jgi:DNA-binding winged helix-turn-helix (wHTH) protein
MLNHSRTSEVTLLIVGDYLFEPKAGLLSGPSGAHHICPPLANLLSCLVRHSNEIVDRDHLINEVWQDDHHDAKSLSQCVGRLRHYFGDTAKTAHYIETVPNLGYRLVAPVYGSTTKPVLVNTARTPTSNANVGSFVYRLFEEFRERKVCRSMLIYTMVIWVIFQVSEIVVPALNLPDWVNRLVVMLGLLGFPVAAILSWIFNLTPSGLVRESARVSNQGSVSPRSRMDLVLDSALVSIALVICSMLVSASIG